MGGRESRTPAPHGRTGPGRLAFPGNRTPLAREDDGATVAPRAIGKSRQRPPDPRDLGVRRRFSRRPAQTKPSAFHRVLQRPPLRRTHLGRVLPRGFPRFGLVVPTTRHVPTSRFLTASPACATRRSAGLLHPAADPEVHGVWGTGPARARAASCLPPPCHALQSLSSRGSRPRVTAASCPLAVTHPKVSRLRGFAPPGSPALRHTVAGAR